MLFNITLDKSDAVTYCTVVKLASSITALSAVFGYSNPIIGRTLNIYIANANKENYALQLIDNTGITIFNKSINQSGGATN